MSQRRTLRARAHRPDCAYAMAHMMGPAMASRAKAYTCTSTQLQQYGYHAGTSSTQTAYDRVEAPRICCGEGHQLAFQVDGAYAEERLYDGQGRLAVPCHSRWWEDDCMQGRSGRVSSLRSAPASSRPLGVSGRGSPFTSRAITTDSKLSVRVVGLLLLLAAMCQQPRRPASRRLISLWGVSVSKLYQSSS